MKKRTISLLLALVMVLGLIPVTARAATLDNGLEYEDYFWSDGVYITGYSGNATDLVIPAEIEGKPVTVIGSSVFSGCTSLTSIDFPDSLTSIDYSAFYGCTSLTSIDLPDSLTSIGDDAFYGCTSLISIDLPDSLTSIGNSAFRGCTSLTGIRIPVSVNFIGDYAFWKCEQLSVICFEGDVPAFQDGTDSLAEIFYELTATVFYPAGNATWTSDVMTSYWGLITWVPYDPNHLHEYAVVVTAPTCTDTGYTSYSCACGLVYLDNCVAAPGHVYESVVIAPTCIQKGYSVYTCTVCGSKYTDDYVDALGGDHQFEDGFCTRCNTTDTGLVFVIYDDHVEIIDFVGYDATEVVIPAVIEGKPVTVIGDEAFYWHEGLTNIVIPNSVTTIGNYAFYRCRGLTNIFIPSSVTSIGENAFRYCSDLISITIPSGVTTIGDGMFDRCFCLMNITIPNSVTSIGEYAFSECYDLSSIVIPESVTSIGDSAFPYLDSISICFTGDAPEFKGSVFYYSNPTVYYPADNPTWTADVMKDYGGDVTWIPYDPVPFTDVPANSFYQFPVIWASENNITTGATATTFNPGGECLRAHVVTFLHRAAGNPAPASSYNPFTDVKSSDFFYKPVLWANECNVTNGISANKFGPFDVCNRAQVVTFLWRACGSMEPRNTNNPFVDVRPTDFYYKPVLWAVENGITNGVDATHFGPTSPCNRAQVVTFLFRAFAE